MEMSIDCIITKDDLIMAIKRGRKQKMIFTLQKSPDGYNKLSLRIIKK